MTATANCTHYWVIEESKGRERSPGTCKRCGTEDSFPNFYYYDVRDYAPPSSEPDYAQLYANELNRR